MDHPDTAGRQIIGDLFGPSYLENRAKTTNGFNGPLRRLTETYCFGEVWARPDLPRPMRSLLCIAILATLGRLDELRFHVGGALNNGCTVEEIREVLLQTAIYAGIPAGVAATRAAEETLKDLGIQL